MTEIFEVRNRTPAEIVQLLQTAARRGGRGQGAAAASGPCSRCPIPAPGKFGGRGRGRFASSTVVGGATGPMMLIPEPKFNWIIAKASAEDMQEIRKWIERLDQPVPTVIGDDSLDKMENQNQVVQRFLKLKNSNPDRMSSILLPMMGPPDASLPERTPIR